MTIFWEVIQWIFSALGVGGIAFAAYLNDRLNKQRLKLDKLKTKFDYIFIERNKVLMALNTRVSNIEMWMRETRRIYEIKRIEDYRYIKVDSFKELLSKLEITLVHGRVVIPAEIYNPLSEFLDVLRDSLNLYDEECEKIEAEPVYFHPLNTFLDSIFQQKVQEMMDTIKSQIAKELTYEG